MEQLESLNQTLEQARASGNWIAVVSALNALSMAHVRAGQPDQALRFLEESYLLSEARSASPLMADILSLRAEAYAAKGKLQDAHQSYRDATVLARGIGNHRIAMNALVGAGRLYETHGDNDSATMQFKEAIDEALLANDPNMAASIANRLGDMALKERLFERASAYFHKAIDAGPTGLAGVRARHGLGKAAFELRRPKEAHEALEKAFEDTKSLNDPELEQSIITDWVPVLNALDLRDRVVELLTHLIERIKGTGNVEKELQARSELADAMLAAKQYEAAMNQLEAVRRLAQDSDHPREEWQAVVTTGLLYEKQGFVSMSIPVYEDAITIARRARDVVLEMQAVANLADVHERLGNWSQAQKAWKDATLLAQMKADRASEGQFLYRHALCLAAQGDAGGATQLLHRAQNTLAHADKPELLGDVERKLRELGGYR